MDLTLTAEQRLLADTVRDLVERECPPEVVREIEKSERGYGDGHWKTLAGLGLTGLLLPEEHGGAGQGVLDLAVVAEQLGWAAMPTPLLTSAVFAAGLIDLAGSAAQRARWLPAIGAGTAIATVAVLEPGARDEWGAPDAALTPHGAGHRLTATKILVPYAHVADVLVVVVEVAGSAPGADAPTPEADAPTPGADAAAGAGPGGGRGLVLVDPAAPGVTLRRQHDGGGEPVFEVVLRDVEVSAADLLGTPAAAGPALDTALDRMTVASTAYAIGGAQRALDLSVEHARSRRQFGQPIGAFQSVAHRCVDMLTDVEAARYLCYQAAWKLDAVRTADAAGEPAAGEAEGAGEPGTPDAADFEVAAAKSFANDAIRRVFVHAHQVHGAIGFSMEHDLQLHSRRGKTFELSYGGSTWHRERVARALHL
ncbi:acyl-CoA dehydrogenase [Frankia torreyi]|uniref:Acyl-CoA dehydrogenase n=2 Tax=Frankia TaxID=1854 RepID=A0A0D8BGY3_9ACTN|nr:MULTISPECIES: acyl-CoA dehydrogenase family protein [Frankia]KJE23310.1 acyl-CoA dehydrogenase [Frankia torreyi]KQM05348.1 acyl-CoA dehydrogenase [Frankia sp. CpI1-P]